ncbi:hypothetical protein [Streptomyces sp. SID13031]|nr:hypothetical protein [Streptomyces sp. SID13031]NEA36889.1 hypothetical protein [Streptomyces sp. SID13031]
MPIRSVVATGRARPRRGGVEDSTSLSASLVMRGRYSADVLATKGP